jgi:hypothetical protein
MKKHMQEDERMKKYYENKSKDNPKENNLN